MILDANQLSSIRQRNDEELRANPGNGGAYPARTIQNLLHTIEALKKEKRKWKKVAQERGKALTAVREIVGGSDGGE